MEARRAIAKKIDITSDSGALRVGIADFLGSHYRLFYRLLSAPTVH